VLPAGMLVARFTFWVGRIHFPVARPGTSTESEVS